jgi:DUF1707 SHOCT-like domain
MSDAPESPLPERPVADLRASDAEREQAVEALHRAVTDGRLGVDELEGRIQSAYTVRTRRELELLIADVSAQPLAGAELGPRTATSDKLTVREGPGGDRRIISVMGGHERSGRWRVAKRCTVVNVMGGSDLDLCDAELADREIALNVYSVMGGAEIHVPHGVDVHVSNFALMGGNDIKLGDAVPMPGAPVIRIRLVSIMGGTSVIRGRKLSRAERREQKELRRAERREQHELRRTERRRELDP